MISFISEDRNIKFQKLELKKFIKDLIQSENKKTGDLSVVLCSDDYILKVNNDYLQHNYFTDIITFDYTEGEKISGDLIISVDRVNDNALSNNVDSLLEFYRVVFHGVLHLCSYKDKSPSDKKMMTSKEDFYLEKFKLI